MAASLALAASAVGDRDRVDLDQVPGSGERLHSHHGVGWLVLPEQVLSGPLDDRQVFGPVVNDVDGDLGDLIGAGAGGGQGAAEVGIYLAGLGGQVTRADEVEEVFLHCAKAFKRSGLWEPARWPDLTSLTSSAKMFHDQVAIPGMSVEDFARRLETGYRTGLY